MKKIIIFLLFFYNSLCAQNLISNPSFETVSLFTNPFVSYPSNVSQMPSCTDWTDDQSNVTNALGQSTDAHSPDWVDSRPGFLRLLNVPARTGNKFVGMFFGELMEQKLTNKLNPCKRYKVSMFIQVKDVLPIFSSNQQANSFFSGAVGTNVKVMLSSSKIKYKNKSADSVWTQKYFLPKIEEPLLTVTIPTGNEAILDWKEISAEFIAPSMEDINWIGIETDIGDGTVTLIDDVKLEEIPLSQSNCMKCQVESGLISVTSASIGAVGETPALEIGNLVNVKQIMIKPGYNVLGQNLGPMLVNISNPGCSIKWDGFLNGGNNNYITSAGDFFFDIEYINDCVCKRVPNFKVFLTPSNQPQSAWVRFDNPSQPNKVNPLVSCCREDITLDQNTYDASTCRTLEQNSANGALPHLQGPITFKSRNSITITSGIKLKGAITFKATNNIVISKGVVLTGPAMTFIGKNIIIASGVLRGGIDLRTEIMPTDCPVQMIRDEETDSYSRFEKNSI
jgi:hypothetical protein